MALSNCKVLNFDHVLPSYNLNEALINFVKQFLQASIFSCQDDQERLEKIISVSRVFFRACHRLGKHIQRLETLECQSRDLFNLKMCLGNQEKIVIGRQYLDLL